MTGPLSIRTLALQMRALEICRRQPGYGSPEYRGDPYEAVALQQEADRLERRLRAAL